MKRLICMFAVAGLLGAGTALAEEIQFKEHVPFADILAEAQSSGKPIMIDFYTVWCGPCKELDREVWTDDQVRALAESEFINYKVDAEKGEGIELAKTYKVFFYPNIVFLNPDGTERDRFVGYKEPDDALAFLQNTAANENTTDHLMAATPPSSSDLEKLYEVGDRLSYQSRVEDAQPYLDRILELDADNQKGFGAKAVYLNAILRRSQNDYAGAAEYTQKLADRYPEDGEMVDEALDLQAYCYKKLDNNGKAADTYRQLMKRHPDSPSFLNAFAWFCATSGVELEEATQVAQRAVELSDNSPGILDTLAEVYYARGMYDDAITAINKALAQQPDDSYFKQQLEKFKTAQEGAEE